MPDLILRDTEPDALAQAVAAIVLTQLKPLLAEAQEPRLVTRDRMAELLTISVPMLDRMRAAGSIPSVMIGARRLYAPADVIAALGGKSNESTTPKAASGA